MGFVTKDTNTCTFVCCKCCRLQSLLVLLTQSSLFSPPLLVCADRLLWLLLPSPELDHTVVSIHWVCCDVRFSLHEFHQILESWIDSRFTLLPHSLLLPLSLQIGHPVSYCSDEIIVLDATFTMQMFQH